MLKRLFLFSLVGVVIAGFVFAGKQRGPEEVSVEHAAPVTDEDGVIHVGSIRLWQDYEANEVAADNVYKDRSVQVTGRVFTVEKDLTEKAVLSLVSGNPLFMTRATLTAEETPRAAVLVRGDTTVVRCTAAGRLMRMPLLEDCVLLRPE